MGENVAIIPVRLSSERFPNKHLQNFNGKPIIQHVIDYTKKLDFINRVVIATEDEKMKEYEKEVDEVFLMEPGGARCGSERTYRYYLRNNVFDYYFSIPADEPVIDSTEVNRGWSELSKILEDESVGTFYTDFYNKDDLNDIRSCKIVNDEERVLYFSRSVIPIQKNGEIADLSVYKKHIGIHVFPKKLLKYLGQELWGDWISPLSEVESLEQNRFLQFGLDVYLQKIKHIGFGIDTIDQITKLEQRINENS